MNYQIGQTFIGNYPPEVAIWINKNNTNPARTTNIKLTPTESGYIIEEKPIEILTIKKDKLNLLNTDFDILSESKETFTTSSLGFRINANSNANRDVSGLVKAMEILKLTEKLFMDFDNNPHMLSLEQMQILLTEIVAFGELSYGKKWILRNIIEQCETIECLNNLQWDFYLNIINDTEDNTETI